MLNPSDTHPWTSARDHFDNSVLPRLRLYGKSIGAAADEGDDKAKQIMAVYQMLYLSFDPLTLIILDEALTEWVTKREV